MLKRLQKPVLLGLPERNLQTIDLLSSLKDFRSAFLKRREMGVKWYECHFKDGGKSRFFVSFRTSGMDQAENSLWSLHM